MTCSVERQLMWWFSSRLQLENTPSKRDQPTTPVLFRQACSSYVNTAAEHVDLLTALFLFTQNIYQPCLRVTEINMCLSLKGVSTNSATHNRHIAQIEYRLSHYTVIGWLKHMGRKCLLLFSHYLIKRRLWNVTGLLLKHQKPSTHRKKNRKSNCCDLVIGYLCKCE